MQLDPQPAEKLSLDYSRPRTADARRTRARLQLILFATAQLLLGIALGAPPLLLSDARSAPLFQCVVAYVPATFATLLIIGAFLLLCNRSEGTMEIERFAVRYVSVCCVIVQILIAIVCSQRLTSETGNGLRRYGTPPTIEELPPYHSAAAAANREDVEEAIAERHLIFWVFSIGYGLLLFLSLFGLWYLRQPSVLALFSLDADAASRRRSKHFTFAAFSAWLIAFIVAGGCAA